MIRKATKLSYGSHWILKAKFYSSVYLLVIVDIICYFCYMTTLTIDVLNDKALNLLKDLELLKIIRVRKDKKVTNSSSENLITKYKGAMKAQPLSEIDKQLDDLRNEWQ